MNVLILCGIITLAIVYIWDWVHFPEEVASSIMNRLTNGKITNVWLSKPWGCSLCVTTWITLIILAIFNWKLIPLCLLYGWSTKYVYYVYQIIDGLLSLLLCFVDRIIRKLHYKI